MATAENVQKRMRSISGCLNSPKKDKNGTGRKEKKERKRILQSGNSTN